MKNIILCADGTWNTPHGDSPSFADTNVRKLYCALTDDPSQLKYYDSGVGTDGTPIDHLSGGAMGEGLFQKVQDCYQFLANVHDPEDRIFLFGFSRGAYTARSVAGMIAEFGVPSINLDNMTVRRIFDAYREPNADTKAARIQSLKVAYGLQSVIVQMIGVWDTVGSLGIPGLFFNPLNQRKYGFLDTSLHPCVNHAYHAVCIDERRAQFKPTLWTNPDGSDRKDDAQLQQVWFAGVHCDIGGSYRECQLSDIALSWMMHKAKENGLLFTPDAEAQYLSSPQNAAGAQHDEWRLVPWGLPEHRRIPRVATVSNTVQMRLDGQIHYEPENLTLANGQLCGYNIAQVLPYKPS